MQRHELTSDGFVEKQGQRKWRAGSMLAIGALIGLTPRSGKFSLSTDFLRVLQASFGNAAGFFRCSSGAARPVNDSARPALRDYGPLPFARCHVPRRSKTSRHAALPERRDRTCSNETKDRGAGGTQRIRVNAAELQLGVTSLNSSRLRGAEAGPAMTSNNRAEYLTI